MKAIPAEMIGTDNPYTFVNLVCRAIVATFSAFTIEGVAANAAPKAVFFKNDLRELFDAFMLIVFYLSSR
ncbi:hypothetical protein, partial [Runella sp.]|uniref:hypothetical protein n=1 Tax=Runella sp. TaxID=1960881 RepID=UPI003018A303